MASLSLFTLIPLLLLLSSPQTQAQTSTAPAPSPAGPLNLTGILDKSGQYTTFIRLLIDTQAANQLNNQLNNTSPGDQGLSVFAPTDNAFNNLPSGALNNLSTQEKVELVQYHVTPKYYSLADLLTVSNPIPTQATGQDGVWGLNFTGQGNQVNVSSGVVQTQINNPLRQQFPLAVYQLDKVLLPEELFGTKRLAAPAPSPAKTPSSSTNTTAKAPSPKASAGGRNVAAGWGLVVGLGLIFMRALS